MSEDEGRRSEQLVEVWGDVVDVRHLRWAVVIGCVLGLPSYLLAVLLFRQLTEPQLARAYALLVGLLACLAAGAINARLFPPKRDLVEEPGDDQSRDAAIAELVAESGALRSLDELPEAARRELRDLGLEDLFAGSRARGDSAPESRPPDEEAVRR